MRTKRGQEEFIAILMFSGATLASLRESYKEVPYAQVTQPKRH